MAKQPTNQPGPQNPPNPPPPPPWTAASAPIVSSGPSGVRAGAPDLSEFEFGLIIANNAFHRWMVRCMAATGIPDLSPLDILVLHTVNHRARAKKLADICLVLNVEDTHTVNYALKKLANLGLVESARKRKENLFSITGAGRDACKRYREIREKCLIGSFSFLGQSENQISDLAGLLRALSGIYDQAAWPPRRLNTRLRIGMTRPLHEIELGVRPCFVQRIGIARGARHVVAPVDDGTGNAAKLVGVAEKLILLEPHAMKEVVVFDPGEGNGKPLVAVDTGNLGVGQQRNGLPFPHAPGKRGFEPDGRHRRWSAACDRRRSCRRGGWCVGSSSGMGARNRSHFSGNISETPNW